MRPATAFLLAAMLATPTWLLSQGSPTDPQLSAAAMALRTCVGLVSHKQTDAARVSAADAESRYGAYVAAHPQNVEALVGLARTKSQCLVPAAGMMEQAELSSAAIDLLDRALAIDSHHWVARFTLATILYRLPSFLGRGERAAAEYDELLRQQGSQTDDPMFARTFEYRGLMWMRDGKADSATAVWARGAVLFPRDSALQARITKSRAATRHDSESR